MKVFGIRLFEPEPEPDVFQIIEQAAQKTAQDLNAHVEIETDQGENIAFLQDLIERSGQSKSS